MLNDAHCHFFSSQFFWTLSRQRGRLDSVADLCQELQWENPGTPDGLADRWVRELDMHQVQRAAIQAAGKLQHPKLWPALLIALASSATRSASRYLR